MKTVLKFLMISIFGSMTVVLPCRSEDDGTDASGKVVSAKVLAVRCQTSSEDPSITAECLKILAKDKKMNDTRTGYENWDQESRMLINDYARSYLRQAATLLTAAGENANRVMDKTGMGPNASGLDNDIREDYERVNSVSEDNGARFLDALDARASSITFKNVNNMVKSLIPQMAEKINLDEENATVAKSGEGQ